MRGTRTRRWTLVLRGLLAVAFVAAVVFFVDLARLAEVARALPWFVLGFIWACGTLTRGLVAVRWWLVARRLLSGPVRIRTLFALGLRAEFLNLFLPTNLGGEAARVAGLRHHGVGPAALSVALDRTVGLLGLAIALLSVALWLEVGLPAWVPLVGLGGLVVLVGLFSYARRRWTAVVGDFRGTDVLAIATAGLVVPWLLVAGYSAFFGWVHPIAPVEVGFFVLASRFGRGVPLTAFGVSSVEGLMWAVGGLLGVPIEVVALSMAVNWSDKVLHALAGGLIWLFAPADDGVTSEGQ